jgi:hypothetical protein
MIKIETDGSVLSTGVDVAIEATVIDADIIGQESVTVELQPSTYVVGSIGNFGNTSSWVGSYVDELVRESIGTGGSLLDALTVIRNDLMGEIERGVNQVISQIENAYVSNATLTTTLGSELGPMNAAILDVKNTYATKTEAAAFSVDAIRASFGGNNSTSAIEAYIGNIAVTKVDANSAVAQSVDLMSVEMNGMSVTIEETKNLLIASYSEWTGTGDPSIGEFYKFGDTWYQYIGGTFGPNADGWVPTNVAQGLSYVDNTVGAELTAFATTVDGLLEGIQNQIDGTIATYFRDGEPTLINLPASDWTTVEDKSLHVGDLYYDRLTGYGYRFAYEDIDDTPDLGVIYSWIRITDVDVVLALSNAAKAQDTADGKRAVFYKNTIPVGEVGANGNMVALETGDIWIPSGAVSGHPEYVLGEVYVYVEGGNPLWVTSTRYTAAVAAVQSDLNGWRTGAYATFVTDIQSQVDKKSETFYQATVPTGRTTSINVAASATLDKYVGDLWKNTYVGTVSTYLGNNTEYVYTKTANGPNWDYKWTEMAIPDIVFDELDTKKSIYTGDALPVAVAPDVIQVNDMWITGSAPVGGREAKAIYIWSGSAWVLPVKYTDNSLVQSVIDGTTTIDLSDHVNTLGWQTASMVSSSISSSLATPLAALADLEEARDGIVDTFYQITAPASGMSYGDYWVNIDSGATPTVYRYENVNGSSIAPLGWQVNTGEAARALAAVYKAQGAAGAAQITANTASSNATLALNQLTNIASDNILSPVEKSVVITNKYVIDTEQAGIDTQATAYAITTEKTAYDNAVSALTTYLATLTTPVLWNVSTGETTIVGTTFRSKFQDVYTTRQTLLNAISAKAKLLADNARSIADSKPNTYAQTTAPSSLGRILGDIWIDTDDKNQMYRWSGAAWVSVRDAAIADVSTAASTAISNAASALSAAQAAQATADGAIRTWYQATAPTGLNSTTDLGDMWFDTDDGQAYRWSGTSWIVIEDNSIAVALSAAQNAQTTADGKITAFYQTGAPATGMETGDIWYDTDDNNKVYYYTGTAWSTLRDGTIAIAQSAATAAQSTANTASLDATLALGKLTDIASDSILSPGEKPSVLSARDVIVAEQAGIDAQATAYSIVAEKTLYDNAVSALTTYLATLTFPSLWSDIAGNTIIIGTTFRTKFNDVYATRQALLNKISARAKEIADAAALTATWTSVAMRPTSLSALNAVDGAALADATDAIADMANDNILSPVEKSSIRREWHTIVNEKAIIEANANVFSITTELSAYNTSIVNLGTYLNAGTAWTFSTTVVPSWIADANLTLNTTIVGNTFRTSFTAYYTARETLMAKINTAQKTLADSAALTANSKVKTFYASAVPTSVAVGDLWIKTDANNAMYRAESIGANEIKAGEWVLARDTTSDVALDNYLVAVYGTNNAAQIAQQTDSATVTYFGSTDPVGTLTSVNVGDIWVNASTSIVSVATVTVNGTPPTVTWVAMANGTQKTALLAAATTKAAADRSIKNYYGANPTTPYYIGDTWMQGTTGDIYVCSTARASGAYTAGDWIKASKYTDDTAANRVVKIFSQVLSPAPTAEGVGDFWKVTDRWYTNDTGTTVSTSNTKKGFLIKRWSGSSWVDIARENITKYNDLSWVGSNSSLITGTLGEITGWQYADGSNINSEFIINADKFKLVATDQGAASKNPFTVNATTGDITFVGKVSFNSVTDAPDLVAENTNINVTTNLVPNAGWYASGHADYQFYGTPTYYRMLGAGTVAEDTLLLNVGDEVYTPYISDMTLSYKLSYSFKGAKIGSFITVVGTTPTSVAIIPAGVTVDAAKWYNVQIAVLPNGTTGGSLFGFIQESATLNIISVISDVVLGATVEKFLMGFVATADTYISRVGIETITSSTLSSVPITASNFNTIANATSTTIDGSRITTGYISANRIAANSISADKISGVNINGYTIEGSIIKGASIEGSVIKSSWIDYTTTGDLTNWQFYTPATIPTAYAANFAHDNTTGALIVDSLGYVRLAGLTSLYSDSISYSSSSSGSLLSNDGVCSYDAYTIPSTKRCVTSAPRIYSEGNPVIISIASTYNGSYYGVPIEYVQFSLFGDTIKVTHYSGGTGFAYWSRATVYKNGIEIARATYNTTDAYPLSVSFSVNSINFIIEDAFSGAVLKLGVNINIQLQTFIGQKAYIFGDFSWYISGAGVRFATISMPSIRYT